MIALPFFLPPNTALVFRLFCLDFCLGLPRGLAFAHGRNARRDVLGCLGMQFRRNFADIVRRLALGLDFVDIDIRLLASGKPEFRFLQVEYLVFQQS